MENEIKGQMYSGIGGQAVIEGIMMKNRENYAVAVRRPDGEIELKREKHVSLPDRYPLLKLPFIRGVFSFADSMVLGMSCLSFSASFFEDDEGSTPSRLELWLDRVFGERLEAVISTAVIIVSFLLAMLIFVLLPTFLIGLLKRLVHSEALLALMEGMLRVLIFIIYIKLISRTPDIRRTFQYHGAEHKCINCIEHGLPLTVENVMSSSKEHKRCGTSFIVYVMMISILLFMLLSFDTLWLKLLSRLLLIPLIAGISYELLRLVGLYDNRITALLFIPGMWMQGLTTTEPDERQVEVAIAATEAVFDWREFLCRNYGAGEGAEEQ